MYKLTALCAVLLSITGVLRADDSPGIDFDRGRDATGIIEHARKQGRLRYALPLDPIKEAGEQPAGLNSLPALPEAAIEVETTDTLPLPKGTGCEQYPPSVDDPGGETPSLCAASKAASRSLGVMTLVPITGPYEPLPRDNPDYKESIVLRERIIGDVGVTGSIPPPVRQALLNRWNQLDAKRTELIEAARPLDTDDERLSRFAGRLNVWLDRIRQRKAVLDANLATYNRVCLGRPLPDDEFQQCKSYQTRFNSCVGRHNASLDERNRLAGVWQSGKQCLESRGSSFRALVTNWVNLTVKPWITDAKKALEGGCDRLMSIKVFAEPPTIGPRKTSLLKAVPQYADAGTKPCPTNFIWMPTLSPMGNLSSASGKSVKFTSSGRRGSQDFRVEATDDFSTQVAGTVVTVAGGVQCLAERTYNPDEDKTTCAYSCPFHPMGAITLPGDVPCHEMYDDQ